MLHDTSGEYLVVWSGNDVALDGDEIYAQRVSPGGGLLGNTQITDAGLVHLQSLTKLESLWLHDTQVTARGLVALERLSRLQLLSLNSTAVTDRAVKHLKGLSELRTLWLAGAKNIGDAGSKEA